MSLKIERFINELMSSNCYLVVDEDSRHCLCIDSASEKSLHEIEYIEENRLPLDYILLTHEHAYHTWGANALKESYPSTKIVCSELCNKYAKKASKAYFLLYYDRKGYRYELLPADIIIKSDADVLKWQGLLIHFLITPGHSYGSMCFEIDGKLFTGDTIMPFKPYFNGRDSKEEDWDRSIHTIMGNYPDDTMLYPGHGEILKLSEWKDLYYVADDKNRE